MKWLIFLLVLFSSSVFSAGRVFSDDFETGLASQWARVDNYNPCLVVATAVDGIAPHSGASQLECNWNATVSGYDNASHSTLQIHVAVYPYTREFFVRFWVRYATDVTSGDGSFFYIDPYNWRNTVLNPSTTNSLLLHTLMSDGTLHMEWNTEGITGDGSVPGGYGPDYYGAWYYYDNAIWIDGTEVSSIADYCINIPACTAARPHASPADHIWHKFEIYLKTNTPGNNDGTARIWVDGTRYISVDNDTTVNPPSAATYPIVWGPIQLLSLPNGEAGANNHVYFDDFEVYTDQGIGAIGSMSDASITVSPICH